MNFMVSDRYSLIVPRNWIVTSWSAVDRAGAELLETEEEIVDHRQQHVEGEGAAEHEQHRRGDQERQERPLLLAVEPRRHEAPELVADHRERQHEAAEDRDADLGEEPLLQPGIDQLGLLAVLDEEPGEGRGEEVEDRPGDGEGGDHRDAEGDEAVDRAGCEARPGARSAAPSSCRCPCRRPSSPGRALPVFRRRRAGALDAAAAGRRRRGRPAVAGGRASGPSPRPRRASAGARTCARCRSPSSGVWSSERRLFCISLMPASLAACSSERWNSRAMPRALPVKLPTVRNRAGQILRPHHDQRDDTDQEKLAPADVKHDGSDFFLLGGDVAGVLRRRRSRSPPCLRSGPA